MRTSNRVLTIIGSLKLLQKTFRTLAKPRYSMITIIAKTADGNKKTELETALATVQDGLFRYLIWRRNYYY